jgi:glycine oxidase
MKSTDVLIIGGGVIGCSIAYQLAKRGKKVTLVEKDTIGDHASGVAGGMLGAQVEYEDYGPIVDFSLASRAMFPQLKEELYALTGMDIQLKPAGMLRIAFTEEEKQILLKQEDWQQKMGLRAQWLSTEPRFTHRP